MSSIWTSIKYVWNGFEAWVYKVLPGLKTLIATGLGSLGSAAAVGQEYISGLPTTTFVNVTQLSIASLILFTLAFWFHGMGSRVSVPSPTA